MNEFDRRLRRLMPFEGDSPVVRLLPGEVFFAPAPHRLMTLLGSCVAVCLWDRRLRMGGMTHSLLPRCIQRADSTGGQGADAAIDELVRRMNQSGCRTMDMVAKLFGGFSALPGLAEKQGIGAANIESALGALQAWKIEVIAQEILGEGGIVIYQNTETGEVSGRFIERVKIAP
jgi:chemotaxis protein CheD